MSSQVSALNVSLRVFEIIPLKLLALFCIVVRLFILKEKPNLNSKVLISYSPPIWPYVVSSPLKCKATEKS